MKEIKDTWKHIVLPLQRKIKGRLKGGGRAKPTRDLAIKMLKLKESGKTVPEIMKILDLDPDIWDETKVGKAISRTRHWR